MNFLADCSQGLSARSVPTLAPPVAWCAPATLPEFSRADAQVRAVPGRGDEQQKVSSPATGSLDSKIKVYEATLRQRVEVKIQACIRAYKAMLLAGDDRIPGPPRPGPQM